MTDKESQSDDVEFGRRSGSSDHSSLQPATESESPFPGNLLREVIFVLVIMTGQIMTQAGVAQGLAPIDFIAADFTVKDPALLTWYMAAFSLTVGTFIISAGRLGDLYGHRNMFMFGYLWLTVWSTLAGVSRYTHSAIFFNICRGFQGIGQACLLPNGLAILGRMYQPGKRKNVVFSAFGACAPGGFILGAVFSSLTAELANWSWAYYLMGIVAFVLAGVTLLVVPKDDVDRTGKSFDYVGAFCGVGGLILINVAWNQAPIVGWSRAYTYILLIIGVLLFAAFFVVEKHVREPLIPINQMSSSIVLVLASVACGWATFGIWVFYLWNFLFNLRGLTPLLATAQCSPLSIAGFAASGTTAFLFSKGVPTSYLMAVAMIGFCIPSILLATLPIHQTYWAATFVTTLIAPFGMDISFPAATILMSDAVPREQQGIAASLVATVVNYSISIGLGIAGTAVRYVAAGQTVEEQLRATRTAAYVGIGMSGLGFALATFGAIMGRRRRK
jgi:MFS family permease